MRLTRAQERKLRNAVAAEMDPYHDETDKEAWRGADIPTREAIGRIVKAVKKL